jgi:hypothetical protein
MNQGNNKTAKENNMKFRSLLVVTISALVLGLAALLFSLLRAGDDSPITVADGSIDFTRQWYKLKGFKHDSADKRHHRVKNTGYAPTWIVVGKCPSSGAPSGGTSLMSAKTWKLRLSDNTTLTHDDNSDHEMVDIHLNEDPSSVSIFSSITIGDPIRLTAAYLTLDAGQEQTLPCPSTGCHIEICYQN